MREDSRLSQWIQFSILLLVYIPSILCAVYIIYNFIKIPSFRKQFQNQTLTIIVFVSLLDAIFNIPITLRYVLMKSIRSLNILLYERKS
jgi:ABC-type phosphate transport system permease subunit